MLFCLPVSSNKFLMPYKVPMNETDYPKTIPRTLNITGAITLLVLLGLLPTNSAVFLPDVLQLAT